MGLMWTDVYEIAILLTDNHPDVDPAKVNFVDLRSWVMALDEFEDHEDRCGEKVLEAIQQAWLEEVE